MSPSRSACWHAVVILTTAVMVLPAWTGVAAEPAVAPLAAAARRAGLRVLSGAHLTLVTDRAVREGDGVDELPQVFDEAFAAWCQHYGSTPHEHADWRAFGCIVVDRERFRAAGLLPDTVPDFRNGFCDGNRFWMIDQTNPAYRRHLLLHEGVHAFTISLGNLDAPAWYTEGIAELLATHRLETGTAGSLRYVATPMPQAAADVEQLGRIETIRRLRAGGGMPGLDEVFAAQGSTHGDMTLYAASWAAAAMLAVHPRYAAAFKATERAGLGRDFTTRLMRRPQWDAAAASRDFDAFTDDLDYGYDFSRSAIDWADGTPLEGSRAAPWVVEVDTARGWQNSGLRLTGGQRYTVRARGRAKVGQASASDLETEPDGISIDWYRGRPLGRLLAAQWVDSSGGPPGRPRFQIVAEAAAGDFTAPVDGPLFFKLNEQPGGLADNTGVFTVTVESLPGKTPSDSP